MTVIQTVMYRDEYIAKFTWNKTVSKLSNSSYANHNQTIRQFFSAFTLPNSTKFKVEKFKIEHNQKKIKN